MLLAELVGLAENDLILIEEQVLSTGQQALLAGWVARRSKGEPLAYILGYADFYGHVWEVGPGVLIPRPDTETLVQVVLENMPEEALVGELGVGSGAVLGTILGELPDAVGVACELDDVARGYAERNFMQHSLEDRVDWAGEVQEMAEYGPYDVLVSNPPYVADGEWAALEGGVRDFEPKLGLVGEDENWDGLEYYRAWVPLCVRMLKQNGLLAMEMGWRQGAAVKALFEAEGLREVEVVQDLAGRDRVVVGKK
jgi:release factor glutamine methyltransferase